MGVAAPATGAPGTASGVYSNTNYLLLGQLLERVTGTAAERCVTREVIEPAGLEDTGFPDGPHAEGPHSRLHEAWFGMIDPPRDYSVFDMSFVGPSASLISTVADLNRFYRLLLTGEIVSHASLAQMRRTAPVLSQEGEVIDYGLGLYPLETPGRAAFWGHGGTVWGGGTLAASSADGRRQLAVAVNLQRWNASMARAVRGPIPSTRCWTPSTTWRCTADPEAGGRYGAGGDRGSVGWSACRPG